MTSSPQIRRVIVVVLDGLRPDAIGAFGLSNLERLCANGAYTLNGQTVSPSVTACAMTSLFSGATPEYHGMQSDKFRLPKSRGPLAPLPMVLAPYGLPASAHIGKVPFLFRGLARRIARVLGVNESGFHDGESLGILAGARAGILEQRTGFILMHWPDADRAGHAHGWMSPQYGIAARRMDSAMGELTSLVDLQPSSDTLLIALADHGGGGLKRTDHDSSHPLDRTIPIVLAGGPVVAGPLSGPVSLLDVPATALWALGVPLPATYAGTPIAGAFTAALAAA